MHTNVAGFNKTKYMPPSQRQSTSTGNRTSFHSTKRVIEKKTPEFSLNDTSLFPTLEIDSQNMQSLARKFLEELPPIHYNVFVYLMSFFREALVYKESNRLTAAKLARICCSCMVVGNNGRMDDSEKAMQRRNGMQLIMMHLLETNSI